jgi:hypothetical protein
MEGQKILNYTVETNSEFLFIFTSLQRYFLLGQYLEGQRVSRKITLKPILKKSGLRVWAAVR